MKAIDKLVLIPIERYERLLKAQNSDNKKELVGEKESFPSEKGGKENEVGEAGIGEEKLKASESEPKASLGENTEKKLPHKESRKRKVPPPPPGVPNKPQKSHFKWMMLS